MLFTITQADDIFVILKVYWHSAIKNELWQLLLLCAVLKASHPALHKPVGEGDESVHKRLGSFASE